MPVGNARDMALYFDNLSSNLFLDLERVLIFWYLPCLLYVGCQTNVLRVGSFGHTRYGAARKSERLKMNSFEGLAVDVATTPGVAAFLYDFSLAARLGEVFF